MNNKIFLSIIIPYYNRIELLYETLKSIINNNDNDFEIILVDDGSTKHLSKQIKKIIFNNTRYYKIKNSERGYARNFGALKARGEYLNFFDSDDLCLENHVSSSKKFATKNKYPPIFANSFYFENKLKNKIKMIKYKKKLNSQIFNGNIISCNSLIIKKNIFLKYKFNENRNLSGSEDWDLWLRLASEHIILGNDDITTILCDHSSRSTKKQNKDSILKRLDILHSNITNYKLPKLKEKEKQILSEIFLFKSMILSFYNFEKINTIRFLYKSILLYKKIGRASCRERV